jgi:hypothetical protein
MVDRPVLGQITRADVDSQSKIEIIGQLTKVEWEAFYECIKECAKPYAGRLDVRMVQPSKIPIPIFKFLPKKPPFA